MHVLSRLRPASGREERGVVFGWYQRPCEEVGCAPEFAGSTLRLSIIVDLFYERRDCECRICSSALKAAASFTFS